MMRGGVAYIVSPFGNWPSVSQFAGINLYLVTVFLFPMMLSAFSVTVLFLSIILISLQNDNLCKALHQVNPSVIQSCDGIDACQFIGVDPILIRDRFYFSDIRYPVIFFDM